MGFVRGHGQGAAEGKKVDALAAECHASVDNIDAVAPQLLPEAGEVVLQLGQVILVVTVGGMVMIFMEFESGPDAVQAVQGRGQVAAMALGLAGLLDKDWYAWNKYQFLNTSVTELALGLEPKLLRLNCVAHLAGL